MSATGRGERGGGGFDFFSTPAWCVDWLLRAVDLPGGNWLEPSAGDGAIIRAVNARRRDVVWSAVEIREEMRAPLHRLMNGGVLWCGDPVGDWRRWRWKENVSPFDVVIGNVPYGEAAEHLPQAIAGGRVCAMLLRLNFLGSQKRAEFWRRHPADVYVLSERPSFDGEGTDATEYAWFVWGQCGAGPGRIRVLGPDENQLPLLAGV